jgi:hypothetical protein
MFTTYVEESADDFKSLFSLRLMSLQLYAQKAGFLAINPARTSPCSIELFSILDGGLFFFVGDAARCMRQQTDGP